MQPTATSGYPLDSNLPLGLSSNQGTVSAQAPGEIARPTDEAIKNAKILIIDDEESVGHLVTKYLREAGFQQIATENNSANALALIENTLPDLVLLDLRMSPVNGLEILERLRDKQRTENIPVIVLTGDTKEELESMALNLGANDFLTKPFGANQLCARVRNTLAMKMYRDKLINYSVKLEADVLSDALTGVANRRAFEYEIKRRVADWKRDRSSFGLLMLDLDHFKKINDMYGHRVGDNALREVASVLKQVVRSVDLIARYGGEEFAIILPKSTTEQSAEVAERIRNAIEKHEFCIEGQRIPLTISVGLASIVQSDDADFLARRADVALYSAKQNGRNLSCYHDGGECITLTRKDSQTPEVMVKRSTPLGEYDPVESAKIAIIDDEPATVAIVRKYLKDNGYRNFIEITEAVQAIETIQNERPDIILLDVRMPGISGLDILQELRNGITAAETPVLIFTSDRDKETKVKALNLGASDFLEKPVNQSELVARVRNTILARMHVNSLATYSARLEHEVCLRTTELSASRREAIQCLARAGELRDDHTGHHVLRVGRYAAVIAQELGFSEERVIWMEHAAQLHDVGKIGIPDSILHKEGRLTEDEWQIMKSHCLARPQSQQQREGHVSDEPLSSPTLGLNIFEGCNSPVMKLASIVAQTHHEKWDGSGYPRGLSGTQIPIEGRITAVADVFDALSTKRAYKDALPLDKCLEMVEAGRGSHFDPDVLDAFFRRKSEIIRIYHDFADE